MSFVPFLFFFLWHSSVITILRFFVPAARSPRNFNLKSNCKHYQPWLILIPTAQDSKLPLKKSWSMCKITTGLLKSCFCPVCILKSSSIQNSKKRCVFSPCAYNVNSAPFSEENKCLTPFIPTGPEKLTPLKQLTWLLITWAITNYLPNFHWVTKWSCK